jgi:hypothetical protein
VAEPSSYTIRVQHFVKLAEAISASTIPKVVVPTSIMTLLSEVISLRKEVSELFGNTITGDDGEFEGHTYFIGVLEQVKKLYVFNFHIIVFPQINADSDISYSLQPLAPEKSAKNQTEPKPKENVLQNVFEALTLEEPPETDESISVTSTALVVPASTQQKYDIESDHNEIIMSSLFFFRDLKYIRDYLTGLWARYVIDEMDLVTVTVVTNTAIELLHHTIQELMSAISGKHGAPGEQDWIRWVYTHICPSLNMNDLDTREYPVSSATTLQADFTCLPALIIVERFMRNFDPSQPSIKPPSNPYEKTTPRTQKEQFEKDEIYLHRYMADLCNASLLGLDAEFPPSLDDITKAFVFERVAFKNKGVPAWLAIALQIQLDIQRLFYYESSKAFEDLQRTAESITGSISHYFRYSRALVGREETFHKDNDPEVLKVVQFISAWLKQDPYNKLIKIRSGGSVDPATKPLLLSPFFFLRENPLLCGLMSYFLKMGRHIFAIGLSNTYDAIISAAHLYNAARQIDLRRGSEPPKWPDMEYILATHSADRLFVGSFPKEPVDFFKRYQLAIGVSPTNFARNKRSDKYLEPKKISSRRLHEKLPIHEIFEPRYLTLEQKCDFSDATFDPIIKELITGSSERGNQMDNIKPIADQWLKTRKLTTLQLLQVIQIAMKREDMHLNYDYFSMHIRCEWLLFDFPSSEKNCQGLCIPYRKYTRKLDASNRADRRGHSVIIHLSILPLCRIQGSAFGSSSLLTEKQQAILF